MDLDNASREELLALVKYLGYSKLIKEIPSEPSFKVGLYYQVVQTGNNEVEATDHEHLIYLNLDEVHEYFED
jgi:mevalonate pyrophosphate decarboxylase